MVGLKQYTLKVRVETPQETWRRDPHNLPQQSGEPMEEVIGPDGIPPVHIMLELVSVFMIHFGSQFPCIDRRDLEAKIRYRTGSSFLLNSIAGIAARSVYPYNFHAKVLISDSRRTPRSRYLHYSHGNMETHSYQGQNRCLGQCCPFHHARPSSRSSYSLIVVSQMTLNRKYG
jgi:hypothetical protein